jgi:hypothetical protein
MTVAPELYVPHFVYPDSDQTDSGITNRSDQGLNIWSGIKFYFETMKTEGIIKLSCCIIDIVLPAQNEAFFHCRGSGYIVWVWRRSDGPHADTINLILIQVSC